MDCYKCTINGKKIVQMEVEYDEKTGQEIAVCPECKREEVVGFGKIA